MDSVEFHALIERVWPGGQNQALAARYFGVNPRTIRRYVSGETPIPSWLGRDAAALSNVTPDALADVDPRKVLGVLHGQMVAGGFTEGEAATAIFASAWALAKKNLGEDAADLLAMAGGGDEGR